MINRITRPFSARFTDFKTEPSHIEARLTAPRLLSEVEGDFTMEATIRLTAKKDWSSAELMLAAGSDFYFRIGLAAQRDKPRFTAAGIVNLDAKRDPAKPIRIRLQRRGWLLTISHQQDGGEWTTFYPVNLRNWPMKIQAGVVALNTSGEPFTAVFTDLKLTHDAPVR